MVGNLLYAVLAMAICCFLSRNLYVRQYGDNVTPLERILGKKIDLAIHYDKSADDADSLANQQIIQANGTDDLVNQSVEQVDKSDGENFEYNNTESGITIEGYTGTSKEVVIPAKIEGVPVTSITNLGPSSLEKIIFADGIMEMQLKVGCFQDTELKQVEFPDSLQTLYLGSAFQDTNIEEVILGNTSVDVGDYAFKDCTKLKTVIIPKCNKIGGMAFSGCSSLQNVTLGQGESGGEIGVFAFEKSSLETITIPGNIVYLGDYLFGGSESIREIRWETSPDGSQQVMSLEALHEIKTTHLDLYLSESVLFEEYIWSFSNTDFITIHAPEGSQAEAYASENGIDFVVE